MIEWFRVHRDEPKAWGVMPALLERVGKFCERLDTETTPKEMQDLVRVMFMNGDWRLGAWVVVMDGWLLVAHLIATPEPLGVDAIRYVLVRQAEVDRSVDLTAVTPQVFDDVKVWTRGYGLDRILMITHRSAKSMARRWGFRPKKTLMEMSLKGAPDGE